MDLTSSHHITNLDVSEGFKLSFASLLLVCHQLGFEA